MLLPGVSLSASIQKLHRVGIQFRDRGRLVAVVLHPLPFINHTNAHMPQAQRVTDRAAPAGLSLDAAVTPAPTLLLRRQGTCRPAQRRAMLSVSNSMLVCQRPDERTKYSVI